MKEIAHFAARRDATLLVFATHAIVGAAEQDSLNTKIGTEQDRAVGERIPNLPLKNINPARSKVI